MLPLRAQGRSYQECAKLLGSSAATLCRLERAWKSGGDAALETKHSNAGRPRLAGCLTPEEVAYAKRRYLESESYPLAFENLADSPICTEPTRELLNRYRDSGE